MPTTKIFITSTPFLLSILAALAVGTQPNQILFLPAGLWLLALGLHLSLIFDRSIKTSLLFSAFTSFLLACSAFATALLAIVNENQHLFIPALLLGLSLTALSAALIERY